MIPPPVFELLSSDEVPLYNLLSRMASSRSSAYMLFQSVASCEPDAVCKKLIRLIQSSAPANIRMLAAKCVKYILCHYKCSQLHNYKNAFLQLVHIEEERKVLEQLLNVVIHLASEFLPNNRWPEVLCLIFSAILDRTRRVPASALFLFANLSGCMKLSCFPPVKKLQSSIHFHLKNCAAERVEDTRNSCLLAMFAFINHLPMSKKDRESIQDLLRSGLDILKVTVRDNQHSTAKNAIKRFTLLIEPEPKFICGALTQMIETMIFIANFTNAREDVKVCALNLVVTLAKTREKEPGTSICVISQYNDVFFFLLMFITVCK